MASTPACHQPPAHPESLGEPLTEADAVTAANLWIATRAVGLSLGDRCCLALAARLGLTTVTADTAWTGLNLDIPVQTIR